MGLEPYRGPHKPLSGDVVSTLKIAGARDCLIHGDGTEDFFECGIPVAATSVRAGVFNRLKASVKACIADATTVEDNRLHGLKLRTRAPGGGSAEVGVWTSSTPAVVELVIHRTR